MDKSILEVVHEGEPIKSVSAAAGEEQVLSMAFEFPVTTSGWLVAHVRCANGAVAHSTPVYLVVDGQPNVDPLITHRFAFDDALRGYEAEFLPGVSCRNAGATHNRVSLKFFGK